MSTNHTTETPHTSSTGSKLIWALIAAVGLALAAFWALRDSVENTLPPQQTGQSHSVPIPQPVQPDAVPGSLSGSDTPPPKDALPETAEPTVNSVQKETPTNITEDTLTQPPIMSPVMDDSIIRLPFVRDVARYLVHNYYPKGTHPSAVERGILLATAKDYNMLYGIDMTGLSWSGDDLQKGRQSVLHYAFTPTMLDALYRLYRDRFLDEIQRQATQLRRIDRPLAQWEIREMYALTAKQVRGIAGVFRACKRLKGAMPRVAAWQEASQAVFAANARFQEALHAYQEMEEHQTVAGEMASARRTMDSAGKAYRQSIIQRERVRESLAENLRKYKWVKNLDDSSALYIASWVHRRTQHLPAALDASYAAHTALLDLANRLEKRSRP